MNALTLFLVGALSGAVNSIGSGGSTLLMPILVLGGVEIHAALAANRAAQLAGSFVRVGVFYRQGLLQPALLRPLALVVALGSGLGAWAETRVSAGALEELLIVALLFSLGLFLKGRKKMVNEKGEARPLRSWHLVVFGILAFWTGFMGAEAGTFFILAVTFLLGIPLPGSLALKAGMLLVANLTITLFFAVAPFGLLQLDIVLPLAAGVSAGGWLGARLACLPRAKVWCYWFILLTMLGELAMLARRVLEGS